MGVDEGPCLTRESMAPEPEPTESRLKGLQVYSAAGDLSERVSAVPEEAETHWNWSRMGTTEYLIGLVRGNATFIAGTDHGLSYSEGSVAEHGIRDWDAFLSDFTVHWQTEREGTRVQSSLELNRHRIGRPDELRTCGK